MWDRVVPLFAARGVGVHAVDLPSCGYGVTPPIGLRDDEAAVRAVLDEAPGDVVLCGHSYGGMVVTGAAHDHPRVRRIVYLCSFMPIEGQSLLGAFGGVVPSFWRIREDHSVVPDLGGSVSSDLSDDDRALLGAKRVPQSLSAFTQPPSGTAWRTIPSTYVVCTLDTSIPPELQRELGKQAGDVVELPTGHHPMLVRPELIADLLTAYSTTS